MKNFIKVKQDFVCENCGEAVKGDGYTDHCPKCLWGKHVDKIIPGDRESDCRGMMEPLQAIYKKGIFRIQYRCTKCGHEFAVREGESDQREKMLELATN